MAQPSPHSLPSIFDYNNYKSYVSDYVQAQPKAGRGLYRKISELLNVNTVTVSQIFRGDRELTGDQAFFLSDFFGFNEVEFEYFSLLVAMARAHHTEYRSHLQKKLAHIADSTRSLKNNLRNAKSISEDEKIHFYSSWIYSAIPLACSLPENASDTKLAHFLNLPEAQVRKALQVLVEYGLLTRTLQGFEIGTSFTHLEEDSPHVSRHHQNWRLLALSKLDAKKSDDFHYTSPMALSKDMALQIRKELIAMIKNFTPKVIESKSEALRCLTIDWFEVGK